jgi:hypothetical protein
MPVFSGIFLLLFNSVNNKFLSAVRIRPLRDAKLQEKKTASVGNWRSR